MRIQNNITVVMLVGLFLSFNYLVGQSDKAPVLNSIQGCPVFPVDNIWNTAVDTMPVDAHSAQYISTIGSTAIVHADFGSGLWDGGPIGIPFVTVPGTQAKVNVVFDYNDESDPGPYPIPASAPIEGGSGSDGDRHVLVLDRDNCILYELYYAYPQGDGSWTAGSGAIYDLKSHALRPAGWTSADAAGLPILPGLVRYEEVATGKIDHAIRFTAPRTRRQYVWPARHFASSLTGLEYPPMGQRFRLKASFDISSYSTPVRVILTALKKYGMILADNGSSWYISGAPDERWNNDVLHQLDNVRGSDFEAVDVSSLMISANSGQARQPGTQKTITVTSPGGGESWAAGSTHTITWTWVGSIANVKIELYKGSSKMSTITSATVNDGSHNWTLSGSLTAGSNYTIKITDTSTSAISDSGNVFSITVNGKPQITLNRTHLNFGAVISGVSTRAQTFLIGNSGTGTLHWTITDDATWLAVTPVSGSGSGRVFVSVNPAGLLAGSYTGTIHISDPAAGNSPQTLTVFLTVKSASGDALPFGQVDSPVEGATVRSSIPVTGWALDDVAVASVKIYRRDNAETVYIGDALFVEGARPDVETAYPDYPNHYQAGWGYMLLTNFLPNGGNGTVVLEAKATDSAGFEVSLGTRTITCDNANAVKPFGAIDTPTQGGNAAGANFVNFGWALTPMPNMIPTNGSTIDVYIDGIKLGHPVYNNYRQDIATLFPGYANSQGAVGYYVINTTAYKNGVHTIQWTVKDNQGNTDGIGSRYFNIQNSGGADRWFWNTTYQTEPEVLMDAVLVKKGYDENISAQPMFPNESGIIAINIKELERLEIHFHQHEALTLSTLPVGATLDSQAGIFYWQPGLGFLGDFLLEFCSRDHNGVLFKTRILVSITPVGE